MERPQTAQGGPRPVRRPADAVRLTLAVAVLGATWTIAANGVPEWEQNLFDRIYRGHDIWEPILWAPMQLGSLFGPFIVALGAWIAWRRWRPAAGALVVGVITWQLAKVIKSIVVRGRPAEVVIDLAHRGGTPAEGLGFPSGHSAVAFSLAAVIAPYLPRPGRWAAYALAAIVAVARIHVGAHFPLDTIGGAALGIAVAMIWRLAVGVTPRPIWPATGGRPTSDAGRG